VSGTSTSLKGTVTGGTEIFSYTWEPGSYLDNNSKLDPTTLALNSETIFTLTAVDAISGCSESDNVKISVNGIQRQIIANDDYDTLGLNASTTLINILRNDSIGLGVNVSIISNPAHGEASLNEDGSLNYTPELNFTGNDTLTYQICDKETASRCATARVIITIFPIRSEIDIYNLVTPDGDGKNDYWHIGGIENFPENNVQIFNRWGSKVKEFNGYNNLNKRWDGTNYNNGLLPDGVYFYIITIKDQKSYTGWVYLRGNRNN
jgi:gliding motility-associated-like protein